MLDEAMARRARLVESLEGDSDQAEASHRHTSWARAVRATLGERWTAAELAPRNSARFRWR